MNILIKNAEILTFDENNRHIKNGCIVLEDGVLTHMSESLDDIDIDQVIDAQGGVVMPGMINAHSHMPMTLFRGYADDAPLMDWLSAIWKVEDTLTSEDVYWLTLHAVIEQLECGITQTNDMYFETIAMARAIIESGMRAAITRTVIGDGNPAYERLNQCKEIFKEYNNAANGRLRIFIAPHAEYTCSVDVLKKCAKAAEELNTVLHVHVSETEKETKDCLERHGVSPVRLFNNIGLFDVPTVAAHCVHLDDADINILAEKKVSVAHNPCSNLKLASGIAPIPKMLAAGINVAIGTDGAGSNNNQDIWRDMYVAAILHKGVNYNATAVGAINVLHMATVNGSSALRSEVGALILGSKCDIIIVDMHKTSMLPRKDTYKLLAYSGERDCVKYSIIDGKIVVKNGICVTLDREKVFAMVEKIAERLL